jgi:hypothetical protein
MGMSSISNGIGDVFNSASSSLSNPSIGMPYGPGYTDPNQQGLGQPQIGMPAGPGYMEPSSGGKGGMPSMPQQGPDPKFNFGGSPVPGMPGVEFGMGDFEARQFMPTGGLGQPSIGMPAGPGYMQPMPLPSPTVKAQPMPLPSPYPMQQMAPVPQSMQQIADQVGLRNNFVPSRLRQGSNIVTNAMLQKQQPLFDRARENVPVLGTPVTGRTATPMSSTKLQPRIANTGSLRRR